MSDGTRDEVRGLERMGSSTQSGGDQWESVVTARSAHDLSLGSGPVVVPMASGLYQISRDIAAWLGIALQHLFADLILKEALERGFLRKEDSFLLPLYPDPISIGT